MKRRKGENRVRPRSNPQPTRHCQPKKGEFRIAVRTCQRKAEGPVQKCSTPSAFGPIDLTCSATAEQSSCRETKSRTYRSVLLDRAGPLYRNVRYTVGHVGPLQNKGQNMPLFCVEEPLGQDPDRGASQADVDGHLFRHSRWSG